MLMLTGVWMKPGVWNCEELDPDPFIEQMNKQGLPVQERIDVPLPHEYPV
jgi:saccharopine dehydrogenase (NAD+, L-lysine-forming)